MKYELHPTVISLLIGLTILAAALITPVQSCAKAQTQSKTSPRAVVLIQSATSPSDAGLYRHLLPALESDTGIDVRVVAVGSGQAFKNASNCDADIVITHDAEGEEAFIRDGYGTIRHDLMYNDFLIVGPEADPARLRAAQSVTDALRRIASTQSTFISRGDDSGTHRKELQSWHDTGIDPATSGQRWYREVGSGMGATLTIAAELSAYTLSDSATWTRFGNKTGVAVAFSDTEDLHNPYAIIPVSNLTCPSVNDTAAAKVVAWFLSPRGQKQIANYRINGRPLFFTSRGNASKIDQPAPHHRSHRTID